METDNNIKMKVDEWKEGSVFCTDMDKGKIVDELLRRIEALEGGKE